MYSVSVRLAGVPWTEDEHRKFLKGLEVLRKGDWRGISKLFVSTRTPTQVASHAQKYFLRQTNSNKKKRRSSLFDVVINDNVVATSNDFFAFPQEIKTNLSLDDDTAKSGSSNNTIKSPANLPTFREHPNQNSSTDTTATPASGFNFLKLSINSFPNHYTTTTSPGGDLELRIAPPQPHRIRSDFSTSTNSAGSVIVV